MAKKYFPAYYNYLSALEPLTDAERGRLFTALLTYGSTGEIIEMPGNERFLFPLLKNQLDLDSEAYQRKCEQNKKNVLNRYTSVYGGKRSYTAANKRYQEKEKEEEKEKREEKEDTPPKAPQGAVKNWPGFDAFYSEYPRHTGKAAALKAWNKLQPDEQLQTEILAALKEQKKSQQWTKDSGQFIPYPATWLNGHRWEDETEMKDVGEEFVSRYENCGRFF